MLHLEETRIAKLVTKTTLTEKEDWGDKGKDGEMSWRRERFCNQYVEIIRSRIWKRRCSITKKRKNYSHR
jgi:hypothetical protein